MNKYIGFKLIQAEPKTDIQMDIEKGWPISCERVAKEGYKVTYPDGYVSWSPKEVFEKAYMQVGDNNTITQKNVDDFIKDYEVITLDNKTTVVRAVLVNNFTIVESSSCVDPTNYCEKIGTQICLDRIKNKVWNHLGFLLQTAKDGIK